MKRREIDDGEHVTELIPGYLLGCLPEEEIIEIAKHISDCSSCLRELEQLSHVKEQLLEAAPEVAPPPELWDRVRDRIHSELGTDGQPRSGEDRVYGKRNPQKGNRTRKLRRLATVLAAALIVALGTSTTILATKMSRAPAASLPTIPMTAPVGSNWGTDEGAPTGTIVLSRDGEYGTLVVDNLKPASGRQYQLWLIQNGTRISGAVFSVNDEGYANVSVSSVAPLSSYSEFGITAEPIGGSPSPTGVHVLAGSASDR